jgi:thiol:disulfide interchange protein DsbD
MGFAMLLLAIKPLSALPKDRILDVASYAVVLAFAVWIWGTWVSFSTPTGKKWLIRGLAVLLAALSGLFMLRVKEDIIPWQAYDRAAIQQAVGQNQPVLIKFTADWCTNCKVLDSRVFHDPEVATLLKQKNILAVKADTTLADFPASIDLQQVYHIPGTVPMTILLLGGQSDPVRLSGIYDKQELFEALD